MLFVISRFCVLFCLFAIVCMSKRHSGPAPQGGIAGPRPYPNHCLYPTKRELCPPSEDCAPKKVTGTVPLECSSRPETPKILVIPQNSWVKNFFLQISWWRLFFCFQPGIRGISHMLRSENLCFLFSLSAKFLCPSKIVYAPQSRNSGAGPGDTNDFILYDHAKYVILLVKLKIWLNSSCNLGL